MPCVAGPVETRAARKSALEPGPDHVDVLVVDDDEAVRSSAAEILRLSGYVTAEAEDGVVARQFLEETDVGVMLLDIRMPRLDGLGLLEILDAPPPVILISAFSGTEQSRANPKVRRYLRKPLHPEALLEAVADALGRGAP
ncbi:MAG TPA: response regulator [Acidimicrobiales bacterium]|nr:response regulator [Acidimicrobiales bacterium]